MDFVPVYSGDRLGPVDWARRREEEGWHGVAMADHILSGQRGNWHPFAALGAMAVSTTRVTLTTAYGNNLMRSPVEFAQASLSLHALSSGRYEVGLGAGWAKEETRRLGPRLSGTSRTSRALPRGGDRSSVTSSEVRADTTDATTRSICSPPDPPPTRRLSSLPPSEERGRSGTSRRCSTGSRSIRRVPPSARGAWMPQCSPPRRPTTSGP